MTAISTRRSDAATLVDDHLNGVATSMTDLARSRDTLVRWGMTLAHRLAAGQRLLVAGNGGSAAEAQHLTAEIVGRFDGEREPFSAISLHADTSTLTAVGNDYGFDQVFARQVRGHGRPGDVLLLLSTSGESTNLLAAAQAGREQRLATWALTGAAPNSLCRAVDDHIAIGGDSPNAQECQLVAVHAICRVFDATIAELRNDASIAGLRDGSERGPLWASL
ncbi:SIS domain-containing protein [Propionimicrobium sp. PCR01-08-3]|uniref:D-sedoheptulose-7-phosphate isomerase n=1 Tax=Propionimicrobium sp. PCR01-08-3 TaxID=3052086 RepID=UPI00255C9538|nr:SIS domain-containing protein [Propionimicrobium sp. PCR01-08-3]WIY82169.1 SIS domain-containing protein [Propionimicrobium sp. PCR01-08-3]